MISLFKAHILADGGWSQLIGIIAVVGFYLIGGIAKAWANRSRSGDEEDAETSPAVEMAKKYIKEGRKKLDASVSEWDRRQAMKRQRSPQPYQRPQTPPAPSRTPRAVIPPPRPQINVFRQAQPVAMQPPAQKVVKQSVSTVPMAKPVPKQDNLSRKKTEATIKPAQGFDLFHMQSGDLRTAMILKEILDKPVALREAF